MTREPVPTASRDPEVHFPSPAPTNPPAGESAADVAERLNAALSELREFVETAGERGRCLHAVALQRGSSAVLAGLGRLRERVEAAEEALRQEAAA